MDLHLLGDEMTMLESQHTGKVQRTDQAAEGEGDAPVQFQTGDLVLIHECAGIGCCSGVTRTVSKLVECMTESRFSHIGIVVTDKSHLGIDTIGSQHTTSESVGPWVWESGEENGVYGVQLTPLARFTDDDSLSIHVRHLECTRDAGFYEALTDSWATTQGRPYDMNLIDWLAAWARQSGAGVYRLPPDSFWRKRSRFWCSALVAFVYAQLTLLASDVEWTLVSPREFSHFEGRELDFQHCSLSPETLWSKKSQQDTAAAAFAEAAGKVLR